MAAGVLMLWSGPDMFASRWTPQVLAFTHLITVGFMLQVMLGAMQQLLPVMAGANLKRPLLVAMVVHAAITLGGILLVLAFLTSMPLLFGSAIAALAIGTLIFVSASLHALRGAPATSSTNRGLRLTLLGLLVTVAAGILNALALGWPIELGLQQWTNVHLAWGFVGWGGALLGVVGFVAVPMFQQTARYPLWFNRGFPAAAIGIVALWTLTELVGYPRSAAVLAIGVVVVGASFAWMTLQLLHGSKRPKPDAIQLLWRFAMVNGLLAGALWLLAQGSDTVAQWQGWPLLFGTVLLFGGFMSVILGMLYKIVPFLVWLHLQNLGQGRLMAPNVKKVVSDKHIQRQAIAHGVAFGLLLLAVIQPAWFVYPAGLALVMANGWLMRNLMSAVAVYRQHLAKIAALDKPPA
jgi:hypothetical protein